ncbi:MAG: hypothetical protein J6Y94_02790, partial [Bacteriovoracaceae bacterium]|nr:hypothetical protein [Bacteriovoracaceae bacterium]
RRTPTPIPSVTPVRRTPTPIPSVTPVRRTPTPTATPTKVPATENTTLSGKNIIDFYSCGNYVYAIEELAATSVLPKRHVLRYALVTNNKTDTFTTFAPKTFLKRDNGISETVISDDQDTAQKYSTYNTYAYFGSQDIIRYDNLTCIEANNSLAMTVLYNSDHNSGVLMSLEELVVFRPQTKEVRRIALKLVNDMDKRLWKSSLLRLNNTFLNADVTDVRHETIYPINAGGVQHNIYDLLVVGQDAPSLDCGGPHWSNNATYHVTFAGDVNNLKTYLNKAVLGNDVVDCNGLRNGGTPRFSVIDANQGWASVILDNYTYNRQSYSFQKFKYTAKYNGSSIINTASSEERTRSFENAYTLVSQIANKNFLVDVSFGGDKYPILSASQFGFNYDAMPNSHGSYGNLNYSTEKANGFTNSIFYQGGNTTPTIYYVGTGDVLHEMEFKNNTFSYRDQASTVPANKLRYATLLNKYQRAKLIVLSKTSSQDYLNYQNFAWTIVASSNGKQYVYIVVKPSATQYRPKVLKMLDTDFLKWGDQK